MTDDVEDQEARWPEPTLVSTGLPLRLVKRIHDLIGDDGTKSSSQGQLDRAVADLVENALDRRVKVEMDTVEEFVPEGMKFSDFKLGGEFLTGSGRWRVTDLGSRVVVAIKLDPIRVASISAADNKAGLEPTYTDLTYEEADKRGWFNGPPYAVAESVFDEYDIEGCSPAEPSTGSVGDL